MNKAIVAVALLVASTATVGCGSKQTTSDPGAAAGAAATVIRGERDLPMTREGVLLASEGVQRRGNVSYGVKPSFVFQLTEETIVELTATSTGGNVDLTLMVVGEGLPLENDDYNGLDPGTIASMQPGLYRVYVGVWGELPNRASYTLSAKTVDEAALQRHESGRGGDHRSNGHGGVEGDDMPLNVEAAPLSGSVTTLAIGTTTLNVQTNATSNAQNYSESQYCSGLVHATAPAAVFQLPADSVLSVVVSGVDNGEDTVVVAVDEHGNVYCNDDFDGLNAGIMVDSATSSELSVFVGTYSGTAEPIDFKITAETSTMINEPAVRMNFRPGAAPAHMLVKEPLLRSMSAIGPGCQGFSRPASMPHAVVNVRDAGLAMELIAASSMDATIAVRSPSGVVICNDDYRALDAGVAVFPTEVGDYAVWLGTYQSSNSAAISLTVRGSEAVRAGRSTRRGPLANNAIQVIDVKAGGDTLGTEMEIECDSGAIGYFDSAQPTAVFEAKEGEGIAIRGDADFDTSLIIRGADGRYTCADDEIGLAPAAYLPLHAGEYFVWTGVFREADKGKQMKILYQILADDQEGVPAIFQGLEN